jgi:hypothetical protein
MNTTHKPTRIDWHNFVSEAFPRAVGPDLAGMCRPTQTFGDSLIIKVADSAIGYQLAFMEQEILRAAEPLAVSRLRIRHMKDVSSAALQFWKTAPNVLLLENLGTATPIAVTYEYIGVFVYEPENEEPRGAVYFRLLYNLKEHTGDETWHGGWSSLRSVRRAYQRFVEQ